MENMIESCSKDNALRVKITLALLHFWKIHALMHLRGTAKVARNTVFRNTWMHGNFGLCVLDSHPMNDLNLLVTFEPVLKMTQSNRIYKPWLSWTYERFTKLFF